jgi:radical SAM-linked protein
LERSIRRAGLPVAYSQGFNPRPQLTFALPIGVGIAAEDELVDVRLTEPGAGETPEELAGRLNRVLPAGITVPSAEWADESGPSLMSLVEAADYILDAPGLSGALARLLDLPADQPWLADKNSKGRVTTIDIRPLILELTAPACDRLCLKAKAGSRDNLRPDLLLQVLVRQADLDPLAAADAAVTRRRLWLRPAGGAAP